MKICIIIPTFNPGKYAEDILKMVIAEKERGIDCVIIDSSSNDDSEKYINSSSRKFLVIPKGAFDHGGTRNIAAKLASDFGAEILLFMTQDALLATEDSIEKLCAPILSGKAAAVYGRQLPRFNASPNERYARYHQYGPNLEYRTLSDVKRIGVRAFRFSNVFSAVRTDEFWKVGGFPERTILNEDMLLAAKLLRAGETIAYVGGSAVYHSHDYTPWQQLTRNFDIGVSFTEAGALLQGARTGGEGIRFAIGQLRYLIRIGEYRAILGAIVDLGSRWIGFKLGAQHERLPLALKKKLSMHSYHWDQ